MHTTSLTVYYEDTDAGGVVYYANYLKFAERARTELLRTMDLHQSKLAQEHDILFVVRNVSMDLLKPARLDDTLDIVTRVEKVSGASINMLQQISANGVLLTDIKVLIVCVNGAMKPIRLPDGIREKLRSE
jgi:acyl-CoA thioester hydrolase